MGNIIIMECSSFIVILKCKNPLQFPILSAKVCIRYMRGFKGLRRGKRKVNKKTLPDICRDKLTSLIFFWPAEPGSLRPCLCWKATWAAILATVEPSTQTRMFSGLMSVWMIPQTLCRYDSPCSTCQVHTSQLSSKHYSEQYNQSKLDITIVTWSISFVVKGRRTPWYAGYCR